MARRHGIAVFFVVAALVAAGCGKQPPEGPPAVAAASPTASTVKPEPAPGQQKPAPAPAPVNRDQDQAARAKPPKQTYPEFNFQPVMWIGEPPEAPPGAGVWLYTKATAPANISLNLETQDLLLVKLAEDRYSRSELGIAAIQDLGSGVVRIVCKVTPPSNSNQSSTRPATYALVKKGVLEGKRFIVVDTEYKELTTD